MGRTASTTADAAEPRQPEIITSAHLANILTLELVEMISEATKRYEAAHLSRVMDAVLSALRGTVRDVRALHRLPAINWQTGLPVGETASDNGAEPEAAEVTS